MVDPSIAKTLPDNALIAASKGGGGIPSWLALSELQSRNNIRASAPVQQPQSTVADDVVSQALRSSGIMGPAQSGQMPMAPQGIAAGPQQAQPQQQMPQQPQSMAKGGPVRMADGGYANMLEHSGFIAPLPNIQANPINYAPAVTPDGTTLESASGRVSPLFGKGPDYSQAMSDLAELKKKAPNTSDLGHWLSNFAGAALASKGNAVQGFGQGLMTANAEQDAARQREFENSRQIGSDSMGIQMHQDERQRSIANSVTKYQESQAGIADAQDRLKATIASGNEDRSLKVKEELANLAQKRVDAIQDFTKSIGNPVFAGFVRDQAIKSGNKDMADLAGHSIDNFNAQQQKTSDVAQKREMAVAAASSRNQLGNSLAEEAVKHRYKLIESGLLDENGKPTGGITVQGVDGQPVVAHPEFGGATWSHEASDIKGADPKNRLDAAAVHWILTNDVPFKGQGAAMTNMAMQKRAADIMASNGINPDELTPIRAQYKANANSLTDLTKNSQRLQMSEDRIDQQIPNLERSISDSNYGAPILNSPINWMTGKFGGTGQIDRASAVNPVVSEYANFMGGGNKGATDAARAHAEELLPLNATPAMSKVAVANLKREMEAQVGSGNNAVSSQVQRTKLGNILGAIRTGNPDFGVNVAGHIDNGKRVGTSAGPQKGDKNSHNGRDYEFDGTKWVGK